MKGLPDEWQAGQSLQSPPPSAWASKQRQQLRPGVFAICSAIMLVTAYVLGSIFPISKLYSVSVLTAEDLEACAWETLQDHVSLLDVPPVTKEEFLDRQAVLAEELKRAGLDAFIAEPSASSTYFANISSSYSLSERPFLMILDAGGQFSYLAPQFELGRISGLDMVYNTKKVIAWPEEVSPYVVLKEATGYSKVAVDEHVRFMIAAGLEQAGIEVVPAPQSIVQLRSVKTETELAILRGINQFTVEVVRSLQKCIKIGVSQHTIFSTAQSLFTRAGVGEGFWALVLIGDQASNPHGGSLGRVLEDGEFVLIDIGSVLHGYESDVTRTILPSGSKVSKELQHVWQVVYDAQSAAIERLVENNTCASVDAAARKVIGDAGYGQFFTHRLGHGLGIEGHEHPYLNGANKELLKINEVATSEPGIYVTNEQALKIGRKVGFGVRHEDPILVSEKGGVLITQGRAKSPYEP